MKLKKICKTVLTALLVIPLSLTIATNRVLAQDNPFGVPDGYYLIFSKLSSYSELQPSQSTTFDYYYLSHSSNFKSFILDTGKYKYYSIMVSMDSNAYPDIYRGRFYRGKYSTDKVNSGYVLINGLNNVYVNVLTLTPDSRYRVPSDVPCYVVKDDFSDADIDTILTIFWNGHIDAVANRVNLSSLYPSDYIPVYKNWILKSPNTVNVVYMQSVNLPMSGYHSSWTSGKPPAPEPTEPPTPEPTNPPTPEPTNPPTPEPTNPPIDNTLIKNQPIVDYWNEFTSRLSGYLEKHLTNIENFLNDIKQGIKDFKDETTNIINNPKGTNFWDFLIEVFTELINKFFDTLKSFISDFFDFTQDTLNLLDKAFRSIGKYIADRLDFLFIPSDSQQTEIKSKIANIKEKSGGIGQLSDSVLGYYQGFESVVESGEVVFTWSNIAIPDGIVIPGGSFNVSQSIIDSGFGAVQKTVKTVFTFTVVVVTIKRCLKHILQMLGVNIQL